MKKFFSLIALVGVFAACQPEKIETTFNPDPAEATITVTAFDVQDGSIVTSEVTFSSTEGVVAGNVITIMGTPDLKEHYVTVTGTYDGQSFSRDVKINKLAAQGKAEYDVLLAVNKYPGEITYDYRFGIPETTCELFSLATASHSSHAYGHIYKHDYSHNGHEVYSWMLNDTDMILDLTTNYRVNSGIEAEAEYDYGATYEEMLDIEDFVEELSTGIDKTVKPYKFKVSAWAYYNVMQSVYTTVTKIDVVRVTENVGEERIAVITTTSVDSGIEVYEFSPNAHYIYGHGHGHMNHDEHGNSTNAGGGIAYAD